MLKIPVEVNAAVIRWTAPTKRALPPDYGPLRFSRGAPYADLVSSGRLLAACLKSIPKERKKELVGGDGSDRGRPYGRRLSTVDDALLRVAKKRRLHIVYPQIPGRLSRKNIHVSSFGNPGE